MGHNCERISFNTQPPEGGWMQAQTLISNPCGFNTQPPEGGWGSLFASIGLLSCFNTQPPEGGWLNNEYARLRLHRFQHTAARRRLGQKAFVILVHQRFQHTAARRRLAHETCIGKFNNIVSTHSRPKAAGSGVWYASKAVIVSTHSRPKAAGYVGAYHA